MKLLAAAVVVLIGACAAPGPSPAPPPPPAAVIATIRPVPPSPTSTASPSPGHATARPTPGSNPRATPTSTATPAAEPPAQLTPAPRGRPQGRECVAQAYQLMGHRWEKPLEWKFNAGSVPSRHDPDEVLEVVKRAFANVTDARNLCGRPDNVGAVAQYSGTTELVACRDETILRAYSVISFRERPREFSEDTLAITCPYLTNRDEVVATDIFITTDVRWALSLRDCRREQYLLEAVMTHEVGHAFGLDHVGRRNRDLTMARRTGPCDDGPATLGLGDLLGLEELYGSD